MEISLSYAKPEMITEIEEEENHEKTNLHHWAYNISLEQERISTVYA